MQIISSGIIIKENRILLIKRSKNKPLNANPNYWSLPWWRSENNETPFDTVIREVREEVWLHFTPKEVFHEFEWPYNNFYSFLWDVTWQILLQEEECDGYAWYTYDETKELLINNRVSDIIKKLTENNLIL
jgi:8-oxo-dGTP pyrophosphatase MutT (NUDIX family)